MEETPIARLARWWARRDHVERPCARQHCDEKTTLHESEQAGHRGFCSYECHVENLERNL